jgi:hypothetical protein
MHAWIDHISQNAAATSASSCPRYHHNLPPENNREDSRTACVPCLHCYVNQHMITGLAAVHALAVPSNPKPHLASGMHTCSEAVIANQPHLKH